MAPRPRVLGAPYPWSGGLLPGVAVVVAGVALLAFSTLTAAILLLPVLQAFDVRISGAIRGVGPPWFEAVATAFTTIANLEVMAPLTVGGVIILWLKRWRAEAVLLGGTMAIGSATGALLKEVVERARPPYEYALIRVPECYSFPSGHALAGILFFGALAFIVFVRAESPRVKLWGAALCALFAIAIALSRVILGVHFFADIVASWMLGSAFLTLFTGAYVWRVTARE